MASAAANAAKRIAVVTGANQGLGFHVVKQLAGGDHGPFHVLLGSRSAERGRDAIEKLGKPGNVELLQVDVTSDESVRAAADAVRERHGRVDLLINNAGWKAPEDPREESGEMARATMDVNFHGVRRVTDAFRPLLTADTALVTNVSSVLGSVALNDVSDKVRERLLADDLTEEELCAIAREYEQSVADGTRASRGFTGSAYGMSKAAVSMLTRISARDGLAVNALCPGWIATNMTRGSGAPMTPDQGAARIVHAALRPAKETSGKFYQSNQESPWC